MMKDYLIESMTSYMRKLDTPAQRNSVHLKKLKESFGDDPYMGEDDEYDTYMGADDGYDTYTAVDDGYDTYAGEEDTYEGIDESLTEARNPENDEINAAIKRYLSSDKAYIPKKDRDLFDKYGIKPDKFPRKYGSEKYMTGPGGRDGDASVFDIDYHPDYDYANKLTKKKLSGGDIEQPTNDIRNYSRWSGYQPTGVDSKDTSKLSWNQFKSLQPYADEKQQIADAGGRIKREKDDLEKRIQAQKDASQRTIDYENKTKENAVKKAKAQHAKKRNESLSLKEMALPEMALQNAPNKNKTLSASDFKAAMGTVEANFDKFMKDKQYDAAIRFLWNNLKTDYNTHFKSMSSAGNDELVADLKKQYSALFSKATHWWNSLPQKKQEEKKKQELWRMLIDMNKMLSLNESLTESANSDQYVSQFSVDILIDKTHPIAEADVEDALIGAGFDVLGISNDWGWEFDEYF